MRLPSLVARRPFLSGLLGVLGLGAAGILYERPRFLFRRYPATPYDDLLEQLGDSREGAARLGQAVLAARPGFRPEGAAMALRGGPGRVSLAKAVEADTAGGRLQTIQGWLLPEAVVLISGIAAKTTPAA